MKNIEKEKKRKPGKICPPISATPLQKLQSLEKLSEQNGVRHIVSGPDSGYFYM